MLTAFTLLTVSADIRGFIQERAMLRYVGITYFTAYMIRAAVAPLEVTAVDRSIITEVVAKALVLIDTIVFAFWCETFNKATMITNFSGDRCG